MRKFFSKLIPPFIRSRIALSLQRKKQRKLLHKIEERDFGMLLNLDSSYDEQVILKRVMLEYHVIEKGLTMPNRRNGFGHDVLLQLICDINIYMSHYGMENNQIKYAIGVVKEYGRVHSEAGYSLSSDIAEKLKEIEKLFPELKPKTQIQMTKEAYFSQQTSSFDSFSETRHSLRNFSGEVSMEKITKALKLAENTPSACNRQSTRVKLITDKDILSKVLSYHHGNRGFGHLVDKLIVLTTDMRYWDIISCHGGYVDGGIYAMNLLYSLHYNQVGACPLNACFTPEEDRAIKRLLKIDESENLVLLIAVGEVPESFMLAGSHRTDYNEYTTII